MKGLVFLVILGGIAAAVYNYASRPDYQKVIATAEAGIRSEYSKRDGVTVVDVQLIKENDHKLTGFVKLKVADIAITHSCAVTLAEDFSKYIYGCSP